MGVRHRFLLVKDLSWWTYNIAVVGLRPDPETRKRQKSELVCTCAIHSTSSHAVRAHAHVFTPSLAFYV